MKSKFSKLHHRTISGFGEKAEKETEVALYNVDALMPFMQVAVKTKLAFILNIGKILLNKELYYYLYEHFSLVYFFVCFNCFT